MGNRTSLNGGAAITYDADDRIISGGHSYDANGNETTVKGQAATYNETTVKGQAATYDFENHLISLGSVASYIYDADGNRYSASNTGTTLTYVTDTSLPYASVVEEYSGSTPTLAARYDYGDDLLRMDRSLPSASTSYYLYDGLGSTRQLVDATGVVKEGYLYDAYGVLLLHSPNNGIVNPFLFQGQQFDTDSNDYYQRARYYDPSTGRFISQDPFDGDISDPISLHRYLYASGDPMDNIDPSGNEDYSLSSLSAAQGIGLTLAGISAIASTSVYAANGGNPLVGAVYGTELGGSLAYGALENTFTNTLFGALLGGITSDFIDEAIASLKGKDNTTNDFKQKLGRDFIQGAAGGAVAVAFGPTNGKQALAIFSFLNTLGQDTIDTVNSLATGELVFGSAAFKNKAYQTITDAALSGFVGYLSGVEQPVIDGAAESIGESQEVKEILENPALIKKFTDSLKSFFETEVGALQSFAAGQAPKLIFPD